MYWWVTGVPMQANVLTEGLRLHCYRYRGVSQLARRAPCGRWQGGSRLTEPLSRVANENVNEFVMLGVTE